jgi:hypothetical protein
MASRAIWDREVVGFYHHVGTMDPELAQEIRNQYEAIIRRVSNGVLVKEEVWSPPPPSQSYNPGYYSQLAKFTNHAVNKNRPYQQRRYVERREFPDLDLECDKFFRSAMKRHHARSSCRCRYVP